MLSSNFMSPFLTARRSLGYKSYFQAQWLMSQVRDCLPHAPSRGPGACDEETARESLPILRPARPPGAAGPIAVPGAAQLLIPLPAPLNGRGLALPYYPPMALVSTACLSMLERACAGPADIPSPEKARAGLPGRTQCFRQARLRPQLRFKDCQVLKRKRILEEVTVR
jgi:hypothetical protein